MAADGATQYGYGSTLTVHTHGGLKTASVIGPKPHGRMMVKFFDENRTATVMPFGGGWVEVRTLQPA